MSFLENTAFLPRKWNNRNNDLQNITGRFGSVSGSTFTPADCSSGFLCTVVGAFAPNVAKLVTASSGANEIYACNPSDVNRVAQGENLWAVGSNDLGLGLAANVSGTFTKLIPGETYSFGAGNYSAAPTSEKPYALISSGRLVASEDPPTAASTIYFKRDEMMNEDTFTQGNTGVFSRYNLVCLKTPDYIEE